MTEQDPSVSRSDRRAPDIGRKTVAAFWLIYTFGVVTLVGVLCHYGLFAYWHPLPDPENYTWDPEAYYLGAGISLFWKPMITITGVGLHPGLPLVFLIQAVARVCYWCSLPFYPHDSFYQFVALHFRFVLSAVMISMAAIHVLAAYVVYRVTVRLTERRTVGILAAIGYGTSIPVFARLMHYNPERFTTIFLLLAMLWAWNYAEHALAGRMPKAFAYAALSGMGCAGAFLSKFYCAAHAFVLIPLYILLYRRARGTPEKLSLKTRFGALGAFGLAAAGCFLLTTLKLSWPEFFQYWFDYAPGKPTYDLERTWVSNFTERIGDLVVGAVKTAVEKSAIWLPGHAGNWFTSRELVFLGGALLGFVVFLAVMRRKRAQAISLALLAVLAVPASTFAGGYVYITFAMGVVGTFFGLLVVYLLDAISRQRLPGLATLAIGTAIVLLVHVVSIREVIRIYIHQSQQYRQIWAAYYDALDSVGRDGRVALLNAHRITHIVGTTDWYASTDSPFSSALYRRFLVIHGNEGEDVLYRYNVRAVVEGDGRGATQWRPLIPNFAHGEEMLAAAVYSGSDVSSPRSALQLLQEGDPAKATRALSVAGVQSGNIVQYLFRLHYELRPELRARLWAQIDPCLVVEDFEGGDVGSGIRPVWKTFYDQQDRGIVSSGIDPHVAWGGTASAFIELGDPKNDGFNLYGFPIPLKLSDIPFGVMGAVKTQQPADVILGVCVVSPEGSDAASAVLQTMPLQRYGQEASGWLLFRRTGEFKEEMKSGDLSSFAVFVGIAVQGPANKIWVDTIMVYLP